MGRYVEKGSREQQFSRSNIGKKPSPQELARLKVITRCRGIVRPYFPAVSFRVVSITPSMNLKVCLAYKVRGKQVIVNHLLSQLDKLEGQIEEKLEGQIEEKLHDLLWGADND